MYDDKNILHIDIVIRNVDDIFRRSDYGYLNERTINRELEEYIMEVVRNSPSNLKMMLVFHIPENMKDISIDLLREVIHSHFKRKLKESEHTLNYQLRQWRINMLMGILFLVLCIILVEVFDAFSYVYIFRIIKESLLIIGWVALGEPLTFILFGCQSIKKDIHHYKKLCKTMLITEYYAAEKHG